MKKNQDGSITVTVYIGPSVEGLVWEMDADEHWTYTTKWYSKKFVYMNGEIVTSYHDIEGVCSGSEQDATEWMKDKKYEFYEKYYKKDDEVVVPPKPGSQTGTPSEIQVYHKPPEQPLEDYSIVQGSWKCDINNQWIFEGKVIYIAPSLGNEETVLGSNFVYVYTYDAGGPPPPLEELGIGVAYLTMDNVKALYDSSKRYDSRDSLKLPWLTLPRDVREKYLRGETVTCSEEEIPNDAPTTELPEGKIEVTPEKTPEPKKPQEEPKTEKTKKVKTLKPKKTESKKSYTKTLQANSQTKAAPWRKNTPRVLF